MFTRGNGRIAFFSVLLCVMVFSCWVDSLVSAMGGNAARAAIAALLRSRVRRERTAPAPGLCVAIDLFLSGVALDLRVRIG